MTCWNRFPLGEICRCCYHCCTAYCWCTENNHSNTKLYLCWRMHIVICLMMSLHEKKSSFSLYIFPIKSYPKCLTVFSTAFAQVILIYRKAPARFMDLPALSCTLHKRHKNKNHSLNVTETVIPTLWNIVFVCLPFGMLINCIIILDRYKCLVYSSLKKNTNLNKQVSLRLSFLPSIQSPHARSKLSARGLSIESYTGIRLKLVYPQFNNSKQRTKYMYLDCESHFERTIYNYSTKLSKTLSLNVLTMKLLWWWLSFEIQTAALYLHYWH